MGLNSKKIETSVRDLINESYADIVSALTENGLRHIHFSNYYVDPPIVHVWNNDMNGEDIDVIDYISLTDDNNIVGYTKKTNDTIYYEQELDYMTPVSLMGILSLHHSISKIFNLFVDGKIEFSSIEYDSKYRYVSKSTWDEITTLLALDEKQIDDIISMNVIEENDDYKLIYIDFDEKLYGANYSVIINKHNNKIFKPIANTYPLNLRDINMYAWVDSNNKCIMFNSNNKMKKFDSITYNRLCYLNTHFTDIFDDIVFVWRRHHTLCVRSYKDIDAHNEKTSYVAVYEHSNDIIPISLSKMEKLDVNFPND